MPKRQITGRHLKRKWGIDARHVLYSERGNWYHHLTRFPGALCDANGYVVFGTENEYLESDFLQRGKELGVTNGIAQIPGYVRMEGVDRHEFLFAPAEWRDRPPSTVALLGKQQLAVNLRHNELQQTLYRRLIEAHGEDNVSYENPSGVGTRVDLIVRRTDGSWWFYEIKTSESARACIREAIGQLLKYAFWPGSPNVARLVVAGEPAPDAAATEYLNTLRTGFHLPLEYEQIVPQGACAPSRR